jgi:hypothetical protein
LFAATVGCANPKLRQALVKIAKAVLRIYAPHKKFWTRAILSSDPLWRVFSELWLTHNDTNDTCKPLLVCNISAKA